MFLPELAEGQERFRGHLQTPLKQRLRVEFLKVRGDLLAHGLDENGFLLSNRG